LGVFFTSARSVISSTSFAPVIRFGFSGKNYPDISPLRAKLLVLASLNLIALHAFATDYYVNDGDDDTGVDANCIIGLDNLLSDQLAVADDDTSTPHTIYVCPGNYDESGAALLIDDPQLFDITIIGLSTTAADQVIQGDTLDLSRRVFDVRDDGVTLENLQIDDGDIAIFANAAGTNLTVTNVVINDTFNDCISSTSDDVTFEQISLNNCGARGIDLTTADNVRIEDFDIATTGTNDGLYLSDITNSYIGLSATRLAAGTIIKNTITGVGDGGNDFGIELVNESDSNTFEYIEINATTDSGLVINNSDSNDFSNLDINDQPDDGINLTGASTLNTFNDIVIDSNAAGDDGIVVQGLSTSNTFTDVDIDNVSSTMDDGVFLSNAQNNSFVRLNVVSAVDLQDGIVVNATSTGNTFNNIVVDGTTDECVAISGDNTTITGLNAVVGDGATLRNCGDFGISANTNPGSELTLISILTENTVVDDGIFIDNYTATASLGDVYVENVSIDSAAQGFTISDSVNVQATNLTIDANNQAINTLRSSDLEITDFTLSSTVADGIQLNDVDDSRFAGNSAVDRSSTNGVGNGGNDHAITLINNSDGNTFEFLDLINTEDDGINIATTSINNTFTDIDITNPDYTATEGVIIDATSTGNTFNNISVDDVNDDCFESLADNTTISGAGLTVGDGGTFTNCGDMGVVVNVALGGTELVLNSIRVDSPGDDGINITNFDAAVVNDVLITNIQVTGSTDRGMQINTVVDGVFQDLDFRSNTTFGLRLNNSDFNDFDVTSLSANIFGATAEGNATGLELDNGSDSNTFANLSIVDNSGDGIIIDAASSSNTITSSESNDNGGDGIEILAASASNIIDGNLFLGNTGNGANLGGTGANSFYANCLRNVTNINDGGAGVITYVNAGSGNFWGSFPADGTGFSEENSTCTDAGYADGTDDEICDASFTGGGANDTAPLQTCGAFFTPNLSFSKTVLTFADDINTLLAGSSPKAIPGATMAYTISVTNLAADNRTGAGEVATITDDFSSEITTNGRLSWNTGTMMLTSPDAGGTVGLTDAADADAGEFIVDQLTARCGTINVTESCTLTFDLDIQ
jgi:hypothetical protein